MRVEMLGCAFAASVLFSGPIPGLNGALTHDRATPPNWLSIPASANIVAYDYIKGREGKRSHGTIVVRPEGDAVAVVKSIANHLAYQGFDLAQPAYNYNRSGSIRTMISAYDETHGRSAALELTAGITGGELLITFAGKQVD